MSLRAAALGQRFGIAVADLQDFNDRLGHEHLAVRCCEPLVVGANHPAANARFVDSRLEIERIPLGHRLGD